MQSLLNRVLKDRLNLPVFFSSAREDNVHNSVSCWPKRVIASATACLWLSRHGRRRNTVLLESIVGNLSEDDGLI